jgi:putative NADH-flavin reductase
MRVAVLGATGRTGRLVVDELLDRGHQVTALVRDPNSDLSRRVTTVVGDSGDVAVLGALLDGADAVVSAIGPTNRAHDVHRRTAKALVPAMQAAGVRRFVGISAAGIDVPGDQKSTRDRVISWIARRLSGPVAQDKAVEYATFAGSDLDWTLVRPPRLVDGPGGGQIEHDAHRSAQSTSITRADLARFVVDELEQPRYVGQAPLVATAR